MGWDVAVYFVSLSSMLLVIEEMSEKSKLWLLEVSVLVRMRT